MSTALRMRGMIHRNVRHFGDGATCTLTRRSNLRNGNDGQQLTTLSVNGTVAAGGAAITLDSPGLEGTLVASSTFTIAGDATVYTVTADVEAASGALTSVAFSPVLDAEATDDAVVTPSIGATYAPSCAVLAPRDWDVDGSLVHQDSRIVWLSAEDLTITPRDSDELTVDGEVEQIVLVRHAQPGDTSAGYRLVVGAR
jgi:hypothetical protein